MKLGVGGGISLIILGICVTRVARESSVTADKVQDPPQVISCDELDAKDELENYHVTLTDFRICEKEWTIYVDDIASHGYLPVYSSRLAGKPNNPQLRVVLLLRYDGKSMELPQEIRNGSYTGFVSRGSDFVNSKVAELADVYPGIASENCWVIDPSRDPRDAAARLISYIGPGLIVLGIACVIWAALPMVLMTRESRNESSHVRGATETFVTGWQPEAARAETYLK